MATEDYSAITGLPIAGLSGVATDVATLSMESIYFVCNCSDSNTFPSNEPLRVPKYGTLKPGVSLQPGTKGYFSSSGSNIFVGSTNNVTTTNPLYLNIFYVSDMTETFGGFGTYTTSNTSWYYNCTVAIARVESSVICDGDTCHVDRMRRGEKDKLPPWEPPLDYGTWVNMVKFLPHAAGNGSLLSTINAFLTGQPILNSGRGPTFDDVSTENYIEQAFVASNATATIQTPISVYATSRQWALILLVLTSVLQICPVMGLLFKFMTIAPDVLGYVSTLTWHNPFTAVPEGGATLDGLSRTRVLNGLKVQIADVQPQNNQRGHIAFVSVGKVGELPRGRVKKGRVYD
ncbi:hypothetical protein F5Y04DRAFT_279448 [Hypomontagnella monticulosa]|nr:hypothetical protein F5Y04DRAFT_279448 [Hypomontagnella monticulosa]